ncbi:MAG TPA: hypothetical protein PL155_09230 [Candidatus Omnitrophota bacterium]|nr:hypothetical protein [Candidatus Omnitrophota bacterium]HPD85643.1 hypothetical protein [Candidatus Omnitrophota bacterium]HRZ04486.1 hypothetical protein [Candidatus Omnitrophota bacterium]
MMKRILFLLLITIFNNGCATNAQFVQERDYDVGRKVNVSYAVSPNPVIVPYNQTQDKYLIDWGNGCKFAYYVNKETKVVDSWEYLCSPEKCKTGINWLDPGL